MSLYSFQLRPRKGTGCRSYERPRTSRSTSPLPRATSIWRRIFPRATLLRIRKQLRYLANGASAVEDAPVSYTTTPFMIFDDHVFARLLAVAARRSSYPVAVAPSR